MRGRGLGLKGRTAFSPFVFRMRDGVMLAAVLGMGGLALVSAPEAEYLPVYTADNIEPVGILSVAVLMLLPTLLNRVYGEIKWRHLK